MWCYSESFILSLLSPSDPDPNSPSHKILLAEDNPHDVFLLKEAFSVERLNVEIDHVDDGEKLYVRLVALSEHAKPAYGLVLMDFHLPRKSAEEVLMALQAEQRKVGIPLVVLTSVISDTDKKNLLKLGVKEVLSKPFDMGEYFALARRLGSLMGLSPSL